jgi:hypothetical protein
MPWHNHSCIVLTLALPLLLLLLLLLYFAAPTLTTLLSGADWSLGTLAV